MTQNQVITVYRPILHRIAASMVRCKADADDLVQDTFLKWLSVDRKKIENTRAYLTRAVINNSLNHIKKLEQKRVSYFDSFQLSDISLKVKEFDFLHLDMKVNIATALTILQERLQPLERAVYLLREVFSFDYDELQEVFKKKQSCCRQLFSRAKKKLSKHSQRIQADLHFDGSWQCSFKNACLDLNFLSDLVRDLQRDVKLT